MSCKIIACGAIDEKETILKTLIQVVGTLDIHEKMVVKV